jgi:excisionase family DNA binding protein
VLTIAEAAERLRVSVRTLTREAAEGRLGIIRIRRRLFVKPAELDRYLTACQSVSTETAGKSASDLALVAALSRHYRPAPPEPTRSRSGIRSAARISTHLRAVSPTSQST